MTDKWKREVELYLLYEYEFQEDTLTDSKAITRSKAYIMPLIIIIVLTLVIFLPAGTLRFWQAWIFLTIFSVLTLFMTFYFFKKSPELLTRRSELKKTRRRHEKFPLF